MLTLSDAIRTGRLREFAAQEEKRGIGPANRRKLDALLKKAATTRTRSKDRTSRSASRGGSNGM
jgi:hypothetical protein